MTTVNTTGPAQISTNLLIQTMATTVANALDALGLVRTTDTGQMNPATITLPAAGNPAGYEIRRFADPLQTSAPIYMRWEPYRSQSLANAPAIRFRFGTGTDGAGNLVNEWIPVNIPSTGFLSVEAIAGVVGSSRSVWGSSAMTAAEARFWLMYAQDSSTDFANVGLMVAIQRTVDSNGVPTADGFFVFVGAPPGSQYDITDENYYGFAAPASWRGSWAVYNFGVNGVDESGNIGIVPFQSIGVSNGVHYPTPWIPLGRNRMYPPLPDWLLYHEQVIPVAGTNFTVTRNGVSRTFRATNMGIRQNFSTRPLTTAASPHGFDWRVAAIWE